jgi:hypothetical protein
MPARDYSIGIPTGKFTERLGWDRSEPAPVVIVQVYRYGVACPVVR